MAISASGVLAQSELANVKLEVGKEAGEAVELSEAATAVMELSEDDGDVIPEPNSSLPISK